MGNAQGLRISRARGGVLGLIASCRGPGTQKATSRYRGCLDHARRRARGPTRQAGKAATRASSLKTCVRHARLQASLRQTEAPPGVASRTGLGLRSGLSLWIAPSTLDRLRWFQHPFLKLLHRRDAHSPTFLGRLNELRLGVEVIFNRHIIDHKKQRLVWQSPLHNGDQFAASGRTQNGFPRPVRAG